MRSRTLTATGSIHLITLLLASCVSHSPVIGTQKSPPQSKGPVSNTEIEITGSIIDAIPGTVIINETYFLIHYDPKLRLPRAVQYHLSANHLKHNFVKRKDHFHAESQLIESGLAAVGPNAFGQGYDRGHMAPAGDFAWDKQASESTFSMANMVPQKHDLNGKAWEALETAVREYACAAGELEIESGPVIDPDLPRLESNGLPIPRRFYKVILDSQSNNKAVGFIMNQTDSGRHDFEHEYMPVREIEKITNIKFFAGLKEGPEREAIETHADLAQWPRTNCVGTLKNEGLVEENGLGDTIVHSQPMQGSAAPSGGSFDSRRYRHSLADVRSRNSEARHDQRLLPWPPRRRRAQTRTRLL